MTAMNIKISPKVASKNSNFLNILHIKEFQRQWGKSKFSYKI